MPVEYVSVEEAIARDGVRMVVVGGIPSPWGEAAKGLFHIKSIPYVAVRLVYDSEPLKKWARERTGPVVVYDQEKPRSGWAEILLLAERLAPEPALIPSDPAERALMFGLAHELCGEAGLGWARRLQLVHAGLHGEGGFSRPAATYVGAKYGYRTDSGPNAGDRVASLLTMFAERLQSQRAAGSRYYIGESLTAIDIYGAVFASMFDPLPDEQCAMDPRTRAAFETIDAQTRAALRPILFEHRDMMYAEHLELPLSL